MRIRSALRLVTLMAVAATTAISSSGNSITTGEVMSNEDGRNELALYDASEKDGRELATVGETLGNAVCPLVRLFFLYLAECTCDFPIFSLKFTADCSRYICSPLGVVCSALNFTTTFQALPPAVDAAVCIDKLSLFNDNFPTFGPFCIKFYTHVLRNDCPKGIANCIRSGKAAKVKKLNYGVNSCEVELDGEKCNSCTPCDQTGSVIFDCSNVLDGFKIDQCAQFSPWLGPGSRSTATLPRLELAKD